MKSISVFASTLPLILALISFQNFQHVISRPIRKPIQSERDHLPSRKGGEEIRKLTGRLRRAVGLVGDNQTAAGVIYHANQLLIREFPDWLVEMDIVKSPIVEEFLRRGINERPTTESDRQIITNTHDYREKKASFNAEQHSYLYWPNARVPYNFHPYIDQEAREAVWSAMDHWMAHTCITFVPMEPDDQDYVEFVEMNGCWSYVGRQGGDQKVSIGVSWQPYCKYKGVLLHELGHSLGFWHEQTRPDRNSYVKIIWDNMIDSAYLNFLRYSSYEVDSLSVPYDYASIMHYPSNAFTKNGQDTIVPLEPGVKVMGQRNSLSPLDIKQANLLYKCKVMNNETEITNKELDLIDPIPPDAFQIGNTRTHSCLTALKMENTDNDDIPNLYNVSTTDCNSSLSRQFWKWTENDTILNIGSYLCLTTIVADGNAGNETIEMLALVPCMDSNNRQKWSCTGSYIQQPISGKCLTTRVTSDDYSDQTSSEDSSEVSNSEQPSSSHLNDVAKRESHLNQMVDELGQFLYNNNGTTDTIRSNEKSSDNEQSSVNGTSHQTIQKSMVTAEYCRQQDEFQMWISVPKNQNDSILTNENSICSLNGTTEHNLARCYANDMESAMTLVDNNDLYASEWITCKKHGYYVTGFYHTHLGSGPNVREGLMTGMQCCATSSVFTGETAGPVIDHEDECDEVEWWSFQDVLISEGWFSCPKGKFLKGFEIGLSLDYDSVHRIFKAKCCRPRSASDIYQHCYMDKSRRVDDTGVHTCRMEGYLVTSMYMSGCTEDGECTENLNCCIEA